MIPNIPRDIIPAFQFDVDKIVFSEIVAGDLVEMQNIRKIISYNAGGSRADQANIVRFHDPH